MKNKFTEKMKKRAEKEFYFVNIKSLDAQTLPRFVNKFPVQGKIKVAETNEDLPEGILLNGKKLVFIIDETIHPVQVMG